MVEVNDAGAVVFAIDSSIHLSNVTMSNVKASSGAALSLSYGSELAVNISTFSNLHAATNGGISLLDAKAIINSSSFFN